jgi:hypothetical protein
MVRASAIALLVVAFSVSALLAQAPAPRPQPFGLGQDRRCLHGGDESAAEAARREEALAAMRLIVGVVQQSARPQRAYPTWEALADSTLVSGLREMAGPAGELARKIQWGTSEPLPGWGIAYVAARVEVRFALTDLRDPCGFTLSSMDPRVVPQGPARIVPLDS